VALNVSGVLLRLLSLLLSAVEPRSRRPTTQPGTRRSRPRLQDRGGLRFPFREIQAGNPRTRSRVFAIRSLIIDAARSGFGCELSGVGWVPTDAHRHSVREACGLAVQMPGRPTALPAEIGRLGERTARDRA
jgi:hypothetical protein